MAAGRSPAPRWHRWGVVGLVAALLLVASVVPVPEGAVPAETGGLSLFALFHVLGYAALAATFVYAMADSARPDWQVLVGVVLVTVAYGGAIELLQGLLPYRLASYRDIALNTLGAVLGAVGGWLLARPAR